LFHDSYTLVKQSELVKQKGDFIWCKVKSSKIDSGGIIDASLVIIGFFGG
jgi:hypothetical protein